MDKTKYYIYNLNGTSLFIFKRSTTDTTGRRIHSIETKEYFSGLECAVTTTGVKFFRGKLSLPVNKLYEISQEEFIQNGQDYLDSSEEYGEVVKTKLNELLNAKYAEIGHKDEESYNNSYKVTKSYKAHNSAKRRMYSRNR